MADIRELLRCPQGAVSVYDFDPRATLGFFGGKKDASKATAAMAEELSDLQEKMWANGRDDASAPRILMILQGMDTSGKGGVIRHSVGLVDPQGVKITAFKAPTPEEREHDFLWRIRRALPGAGMIGVFDRSQYEDVLIQRVEQMVSVDEWMSRYERINEFEREVAESGTRIIKCFLNVSKAEQQDRLLARLENPDKHWKYNPGDVDVRRRWDDYMAAYSDALTKCNTDWAPWYVIPADRKWYRNWAVANLLLAELRDLDQSWPTATFDPTVEAERVRNS